MTEEKTKLFPNFLLAPIRAFLRGELFKLKRQKNDAKKEDPFKDSTRLSSNSLESDVDEQLGHQNTEMRVSILAKRIVQVRKALTQMKMGRYGICEKCGKMIDTDRLSIYPETTLCLDCQKQSE